MTTEQKEYQEYLARCYRHENGVSGYEKMSFEQWQWNNTAWTEEELKVKGENY